LEYTVRDVYAVMDRFAPFNTAEHWDNVGLLIGSFDAPVSTVMLCLDVTPAIVREAQQTGAQLLISHHPVIFDPLRQLPFEGLPAQLVRAEIGVISAHTNLDLAADGVNDCLVRALGLLNPAGLERSESGCWLGRIGQLPVPMEWENFVTLVKSALSCRGVRVSPGFRPISTVAVGGGACASLLSEAAARGADAMVTSDVKHNVWYDAARLGICLVDAGHFETENLVMGPLCEKLRWELPGIRFMIAQANQPPVRYL
jgi:dinuclear metal center YbgI/SA1388 family protein